MNKTLLSLVMLFLAFSARSQQWEAGGLAGMINYYGDLQPRSLTFKYPHLAYGAFLRYNYSEKWAFRVNGLVSALEGADADYPKRVQRGYSFESDLRQMTFSIEWFPFGKKERDKEGYLQKNNAMYLLAGGGLGLIHTRTRGLPRDSPDVLNRGSYEMPTIINLGIGYKWDLNPFTNMGIEYILHTSNSDYLDGISEAGNPDHNDWFNYVGLNVSYVLQSQNTTKEKKKKKDKKKKSVEAEDKQ